MLQKLVTDHPRLKEEQRTLARSGKYSRENLRKTIRGCKSPNALPPEAIELVAEAQYMCPRCRDERARLIAAVLGSADKAPIIQCEKCKGFSIRVYKRLDRPSPCCFQPVILKDGEPVKQIFVRSKKPEVSLYHFAVPALDYFIRTGKWPEKTGIALPI